MRPRLLRGSREAGVEAVADELGCAVSTASTLLRRAERELVADLFERPPGPQT